MLGFLRKNKLLNFSLMVYAVMFMVSPDKGGQSLFNTGYYIKEMMTVLPLVFILTSLLEAWVPKEVIMNSFGENSGAKGILLSFILGSFSAGPIYAAFPVCKMLLKKGAGVMNIVIILSAWAVIKVPMLANEAKFLGVSFMAIRWAFTVISIIILGFIVSKTVNKDELTSLNVAGGLSLDASSNPISYNTDYCIGCGICTKVAPDLFYMDGKKAVLTIMDYYDNYLDSISVIEKKCPGKAITLNV